MASGAYLTEIHPYQAGPLWNKLFRARSRGARLGTAFNGKLFTKAGVPASDTEADSPGLEACWIIDTTNTDLYFCYAWASTTNFDIAKIDFST